MGSVNKQWFVMYVVTLLATAHMNLLPLYLHAAWCQAAPPPTSWHVMQKYDTTDLLGLDRSLNCYINTEGYLKNISDECCSHVQQLDGITLYNCRQAYEGWHVLNSIPYALNSIPYKSIRQLMSENRTVQKAKNKWQNIYDCVYTLYICKIFKLNFFNMIC